jgi:valyl-tRNA synthetase
MYNNRIFRNNLALRRTHRIEEKKWNSNNEEKIRQKWENARVDHARNIRQLVPFVIDTPPPYPSGRPWHLGAAAHYAQIDMIARIARMSGLMSCFNRY